MENDPRRRRSRGRRGAGRSGAPDPRRPNRAPAEPKGPPQRALVRRDRAPRRRPPRSADDLRPGTPCVIVMDCREGEPDRSGSAAVFEGFFDLDTGELRRSGAGVPRLRIAPAERVWGFECWWRPDPAGAGLTDVDRLELEQSKKLLRGLIRDSRRAGRPLAVR
jgi:hypothetical protein